MGTRQSDTKWITQQSFLAELNQIKVSSRSLNTRRASQAAGATAIRLPSIFTQATWSNLLALDPFSYPQHRFE